MNRHNTLKNDKRNLYVLANSVWNADDYLNNRNTDPLFTDLYLFGTKEEAVSNAQALHADDSIYNDCTIYTGELTDEEIMEITGFDCIEDFNEALEEPYSDNPNVKNYGEMEKIDVAKAIIENSTGEETIKGANYDFEKSLEGCILVFWSWQTHIGYARKCIDIRRAEKSDTAAILTKKDKVFVTQCDILLTAKEVADAENLQESVHEALRPSSWKWVNPHFAENLARELI